MTEKAACILADPPWKFNAYDGRDGPPSRAQKWGLACAHYSTTSTEDLMTIPVADMAAKDCALFMWVVDSNMEQAFALGRAWGFEYKTCAFVWVKSNLGGWPREGLGYWTRKQTEQCWLFTRGSPKRISKSVPQLIHCKRGAHSAKPDQQYTQIEALVGGPYLEMFARSRRPGWMAWGDEVGIRDGSLAELWA